MKAAHSALWTCSLFNRGWRPGLWKVAPLGLFSERVLQKKQDASGPKARPSRGWGASPCIGHIHLGSAESASCQRLGRQPQLVALHL
jgi:hypothetical protein